MTEEIQTEMKRAVAAERTISTLKPDDIRVRLLGTIVDISENTLILDDGTDNIKVVGNTNTELKPGMFVRVIGRIAPSETGPEINSEIIQKFDTDINLFKKVSKLAKEVGGEYFV